MRMTYTEQIDAVYIYIDEEEKPIVSTRHVALSGTELLIDFCEGNRVVGIEVLGASRVFAPHVLTEAEQLS